MINIVFVIFVIILISYSGKSDLEILQQFEDFQSENGKIPAIEQHGSFSSSDIGKVAFISDLKFDNIDIIRTVLSIETVDTSGGGISLIYLLYVDNLTWKEMIVNPLTKMLVSSFTNINESELLLYSSPLVNNNLTLTENEIDLVHTVPDILTNFIVFTANQVVIIQPLENYINYQVRNKHTIQLAQYHYFSQQFINNVENIDEIARETNLLLDFVILDSQNYINYVEFSKYTPYITNLKGWQKSSYRDFGTLIAISSIKIIFIELTFIGIFQINLKNKFAYIQLLYSRGMSFDKIKKKMQFSEIKSIVAVGIFSVLTPIILKWSSFQLIAFLTFIFPWLLLYLLAVSYLLARNFRIYKNISTHNIQLKVKNNFPVYKLLGGLSMVFLLIYLIGIVMRSPLTLLSLYRFISFLCISILFYFLEGTKIAKKINPLSESRLIFDSFRKFKFLVFIPLLLITANAAISQQITLSAHSLQNSEKVQGNMGDFTISFQITTTTNAINISKFYDIKDIQSVLPIYSFGVTTFEYSSENSDDLGFSVKLVNQTLYDNFECNTCDEIKKDKFFNDKIWFSENYYAEFGGNSKSLSFEIDGVAYPVDRADFALMNEKSGIWDRGGNSIVSSLESWFDKGLPLENNPRMSFILSFMNVTMDKEIVAKRVDNVFSIPQGNVLVQNNNMRIFNDEEKILILNDRINILFNFILGIVLFYLIIDNKVIHSLRYFYIKYGSQEFKKVFLKFTLVNSSLFFIFGLIGIFYSVAGTWFNVSRYYYIILEWSDISNFVLVTILPQILAQSMYAYYIKRKIVNIS